LVVVEFEALVVVCVKGFAQRDICKEGHELAELVVLKHVSDLFGVCQCLAIGEKMLMGISVFDDFGESKYDKSNLIVRGDLEL
jgi:hypothetical protein